MPPGGDELKRDLSGVLIRQADASSAVRGARSEETIALLIEGNTRVRD